MASQRLFELRILKYVPNPVQNLAVNVGVILMEVGAEETAFVGVRLTEDWRHARLLDPFVDVDLFQSFAQELREGLQSQIMDRSRGGEAVSRQEWLLHVLDDSSNVIQVSERIALAADDPEEELEKSFRAYCDLRVQGDPTVRRELAGRLYIKNRMAEAFRMAGVWGSIRKDIGASEFGVEGDKFTLDFGYELSSNAPADRFIAPVGKKGQLRFFHALPLRTNPESSKAILYSWGNLYPAITKAGHAGTILTTIVDDGLDQSGKDVQDAIERLMKAGVWIKSVSAMPEIAAGARLDLKL